LGKEAKTEIRGSDGSKFEEESMWQGKPITSWSLEEKNIFFDKLKGREIEGLANYFGTAGFFSIQNFMERELPEVWNQYLYETHGNVWLSTKGWKRYDVILNAMLDLDNLLAFLLEHTEWAYFDYPDPQTGEARQGKHPALLFAEGLKEEPCDQ